MHATKLSWDSKHKVGYQGRRFHGIMSYGRGSMGSRGHTQGAAQLGRAQPDCIPPNPTFAIGKVLVAKTRISLGLMAAVGRPARDNGVNLSWSKPPCSGLHRAVSVIPHNPLAGSYPPAELQLTQS